LLELSLRGPASEGRSLKANPFAIMVDVVFSGPNGSSIVPAFYDGDGEGKLDGDVWKVRFSPDLAGAWSWVSHSTEPGLNHNTGSFLAKAVRDPDRDSAPRLRATKGAYLIDESGKPWLKAGANEPEDFLNNPRLPTLQNKLEAIDDLHRMGVNSLYLMPLNIDGDRKNVWPWIGSSSKEAKQNTDRFDVARLAEWETIFTHMQRRGIVIEMVLEDDSAWSRFPHERYYRELVARFGHHKGLIWYLAEEYNETYSAKQISRFAALMRSIDPYDHPIAIHHAGKPKALLPFLSDPNIDVASLQTNAAPQNRTAAAWWERSRRSPQRLVVSLDETGAIGPKDRALSRHIVWSAYLGGAYVELYTKPIYRKRHTFRSYESHFTDMARARRIIEGLPFGEMEPSNSLLRGSTPAYLFAKPGEVYVVYLPEGGQTRIDLIKANGQYDLQWFDPRSDATRDGGTVSGGVLYQLPKPPLVDDVVAVLRRRK